MLLNRIGGILAKSAIFFMIVILISVSPGIRGNFVLAQNTAKKESFPNAKSAKNEKPVTLGTSACLIDAKTGYMIYGVDEHEKAYPASTTKIMTGLLAMEYLKPDEMITVDRETEEQGGSQLYLAEGEKLSAKDLLYGMMLPSANDAAMALGNAMGGTNKNFAKMMNEKAAEIGATGTHFVNPNGLPDDDHYTTAYDLALIAKEAMKYDEFRKVVSTYQYRLKRVPGKGADDNGDDNLIHNRNRLLYNINRKVEAYGETKSIKYEGVTGIKTGYTEKARACLVGSAERNGTELIAVTMKTEGMNAYQDVVSMLDYGFNNYKTVEVMKDGEKIDDLKVDGGTGKYAEAVLKDGLYATVPVDFDEDGVTLEKKYRDIAAPYKSGEDGGVIEAYYDDVKMGEANVSITEGMDEGSFWSKVTAGEGLMGTVIKIVTVLLILILAVLILRAVNKMRYRKARRRRRRERMQ